MTANVVDERRLAAQRKLDRARQRRDKPRRGLVAEQLVNDWSSEQRGRIRADLLRLIGLDYARIGAEVIHTPEMQVVALIDQIGSEEAV